VGCEELVVELLRQVEPHHERVRGQGADGLAAATRPGTMTIPRTDILANVQAFQSAFRVLDDTQAVFSTLCSLISYIPMAGKQIHDANLVAAMVQGGVRHLLTHNVSDFTRFGLLITVLPLVASS